MENSATIFFKSLAYFDLFVCPLKAKFCFSACTADLESAFPTCGELPLIPIGFPGRYGKQDIKVHSCKRTTAVSRKVQWITNAVQ